MSRLILILYILATSLGLVILKLGTRSGMPIEYINNRVQFNINASTIIGLGLYGISFILYVYLISKNDLGYIIPLAASFVYIIIFVASYYIFNEAFTVVKVMGIFLILSGLVLLNVGKQ